ncbi:MAG: 4-hydroxythreonine-4-phosphate dehydrogenase PdxA [Candidatus Omnitrophota bacterium]
MKRQIKKIGITLGDPSGIGPEVIVKALSGLSSREIGLLCIIGNSFVLERIPGWSRFSKKIYLFDLDNINKNRFCFGRVSSEFGKASLEYLNFSLALIKAKEFSALVTCPVNKYSINLIYRNFLGQTEYLAKFDHARLVRMMLLSKELKFSLVSTHLPLKTVCQKLKKEDIVETIVLTALELKRLFFRSHPKIGVCGLNPHLGEGGLVGKEEDQIIKPAIIQAQKKIKVAQISGPWALEKIVFALEKREIDTGICLYHDQAMVPLKLLKPKRGINLTLGLSFVRTSPLHGTAFDIAGKNNADPTSLIDAIRLALELSRLRK